MNLFDPEVAYELRELINQMETSKELKVIVFDSADPDFYIEHVDIARAGEFPTYVDPTGLRILPDFLQLLARLPIISIASIRGRARGIGAEFVEGLDIRPWQTALKLVQGYGRSIRSKDDWATT